MTGVYHRRIDPDQGARDRCLPRPRENAVLINSSEGPLTLADARLQLRGLMQGEPDAVANAANFTALLAMQFERINWLGCYFLRGEELVLGPFQGRPACVRIPLGRGGLRQRGRRRPDPGGGGCQ